MNLENLSGLELGKLVNRKVISPVEVIEYFQKRIEERNPSINAFVYTKFDYAKKQASELESRIMNGDHVGPLAGVPIGLKDFLPTKKGWTASHGGVKCFQTIDNDDSMFTQAAEKNGAIAIGKTNAPSFGFRGTTDNKMYGPTSTPFNVRFNSGGSSGGSAAAVGDGLVAIAEGGDAGGSIRIPAAWCGCFGMKPSAGIVPNVCRPDAWTATHPYCCGGPITRTVDDSIAVLFDMIGYSPKDPIGVPISDSIKSELYKVAKDDLARISDLKITSTLNFDLFPDPEGEFTDMLYSLCSDLSKYVKGVEYPGSSYFSFNHSLQDIEEAWLTGISLDDAMSSKVGKLISSFKDDFPHEFIYWRSMAEKVDLSDYQKFHEIRTDILDAHLEVFNHSDIVLAPISGCGPVLNGCDNNTKGPNSISGQKVNPLIGFAYTYLENMTGFPAASIPLGVDKNGLPVGLQVIGKRYRDADVLAVCKLIEKIRPWSYAIPFSREVK